MRIALFGGSFDPPHRGHLAIATAAADAFDLDEVLFAPAGRQPLKLDSTPAAPFADRIAMLNLDAPHSDGTPNYTVQTLTALHQLLPDDTLFNLVGADSFLDLPLWHEPELLLELAEWIVVSRPGASLDDLSALKLTPIQQNRVHLLQTVHEDVAATDLRQRLESGAPCTD